MHWKKYIAPIAVSVLLLAYYLAIACFFASASAAALPLYARALLILVPLALAGVVLHVLLQRIREIGSGEEDDLDRY